MTDKDEAGRKKHPDMVETATRETLPLDLTALILCGGRSRRMGRPKAFLPFSGTTMVNHILAQVKDMFAETFLVTNEPESYEDFDVDVVKDILPYRGPLGGILSGLLVSQHSHAFVIACDMPLVTPRLIRELCQRRFDHDVIVTSHGGGVEPLLGVYAKTCIKPLEESLFNGDLALRDFLSGLDTSTYDLGEDEGGSLPAYFNVNTPQDYSRLVTGGTVFELNSKRVD